MSTYLERLAARTRIVGSVLCLGVDPSPEALPEGFAPNLSGIERFCEVLLDAALPYAAAVKPNLAFFEAFGSPGIAVLERMRWRVPSDVPFVADAKRGDIGSTAARQAVVANAQGYARLLRAHIAKEDGVLFPMAAEVIPAAKQAAVVEEFERVEHEETGEGVHEKYLALADRLEQEVRTI